MDNLNALGKRVDKEGGPTRLEEAIEGYQNCLHDYIQVNIEVKMRAYFDDRPTKMDIEVAALHDKIDKLTALVEGLVSGDTVECIKPPSRFSIASTRENTTTTDSDRWFVVGYTVDGGSYVEEFGLRDLTDVMDKDGWGLETDCEALTEFLSSHLIKYATSAPCRNPRNKGSNNE